MSINYRIVLLLVLHEFRAYHCKSDKNSKFVMRSVLRVKQQCRIVWPAHTSQCEPLDNSQQSADRQRNLLRHTRTHTRTQTPGDKTSRQDVLQFNY
jgi:hypothetical protein